MRGMDDPGDRTPSSHRGRTENGKIREVSDGSLRIDDNGPGDMA